MESLYGDGRVREMEFLRNLKRDRKKINTGEKKGSELDCSKVIDSSWF